MNPKLINEKQFAEPVVIEFYDHCSTNGNSLAPLKCWVVGYLVKSDKLCYYVCSWIAEDGLDSENADCYAILKKTVVKVMKLKLKRGKR